MGCSGLQAGIECKKCGASFAYLPGMTCPRCGEQFCVNDCSACKAAAKCKSASKREEKREAAG